MQSHIETIPCGRGRDLRIELQEYKGTQMIQLRQWVQPYHSTDDDERIPSRNGIAFKAALLAEVMRALEMAKQELKGAKAA